MTPDGNEQFLAPPTRMMQLNAIALTAAICFIDFNNKTTMRDSFSAATRAIDGCCDRYSTPGGNVRESHRMSISCI